MKSKKTKINSKYLFEITSSIISSTMTGIIALLCWVLIYSINSGLFMYAIFFSLFFSIIAFGKEVKTKDELRFSIRLNCIQGWIMFPILFPVFLGKFFREYLELGKK